jgi:type II secretory ATPase GspE/PulE/Tfp pilus assembly ATPase PilB-like protein
MGKKIGELLLEFQLIDQKQLDQVMAEQKRTGDRMGDIIIRRGLVTAEDLENILSRQHSVPSINLEHYNPPADALTLVPERYLRDHQLVPLEVRSKVLSVAMANPRDYAVIDELRFMTGHRVTPLVAASFDIRRTLDRLFPASEGKKSAGRANRRGSVPTLDAKAAAPTFEEAVTRATAGSVPDGVEILLATAAASNTTHIHIHTGDGRCYVRFRKGGKLTAPIEAPGRPMENLVMRLKLLCGMHGDKVQPRQGFFDAKISKNIYRFGLSALPTEAGESVIVSLGTPPLHPVLTLDVLGMYPDTLELYKQVVGPEGGLVLFAAPQGSGKTSTIYATLEAIKNPQRRFATFESPIRRRIEGVDQFDPSLVSGLDPIAALNGLLTQDLDCLTLGDLGAPEEMTAALRAARNGVLVLGRAEYAYPLSFLFRSISTGTPPQLLASALKGLVGQRLVDMLCSNCLKPETPTEALSRELKKLTGRRSPQVYKAVGCDKCRGTGRMGKVGLFEVIPVDEKLRRLIATNAAERAIRDILTAMGAHTLRMDGLMKAADGLVAYEDVLAAL